ncbi:MAG TPA: trypsin-like peptidase domain-containing protein [Candidatus Binatia bacterium]|nr:trypsin-like peptidase domain-containing protein [Candidatus Binatia bacterium]
MPVTRSLIALIAILCASPVAAGDASRRTPVVEAVEKVSPAVVNVSAEQIVEQQANPFGAFRDPMFDQFFRDFVEPRRERVMRTSLGSGVLIRADGYILTNQHVVLKGSRIHVSLVGDREFEAKLVGADSDSDLAVLRVQASGELPFVEMGHSDDLMIGETVIAIGNPFGLSHTVTTGVVSAVGRSLQQNDQTYYDFIQTDASINPGNSGGPLLNIKGELIGINTAIYQNAQGIGFAIPVDRARRIVTDLITFGEVQVPWVGAVVQNLTVELAQHFGVRGKRGVLVRGVEAESPASRAGVARGDVILAIDGHDVHSSDEYDQRVRDHAADSALRFAIVRDGTEQTIVVQASQYPIERADDLSWTLLGFRLAESRGALVVRAVRPDSNAARIGMRSGDFVVALAGVPLTNLTMFRKKLIEVRLSQSVLLSVQRGNYVYNIQVPMGGRLS